MRGFAALLALLAAAALAQTDQSNRMPANAANPQTYAPAPAVQGNADAGGDTSTFSGAGSTVSTGPQVGTGSNVSAGPQVGPPDRSEPADAGIK